MSEYRFSLTQVFPYKDKIVYRKIRVRENLEYHVSRQNFEYILGNFWNPQIIQPKRCLLCLNEKLAIALHKNDSMLNKRSEVVSKCMHKNKYMLVNYDSKGLNDVTFNHVIRLY